MASRERVWASGVVAGGARAGVYVMTRTASVCCWRWRRWRPRQSRKCAGASKRDDAGSEEARDASAQSTGRRRMRGRYH